MTTPEAQETTQASQPPNLTPSGEVAVFVDDDQFGPGQSVDKCGPEAVAIVWHSVAPGQHNPYSAADVHSMAHQDYEKWIGPDVASDQGGTSNQTLYNMLQEHGFKYTPGPTSIAWVKEQLNAGLIVIIGIVESSVVDNALGANPYNWNTTGLTHVITASGPGRPGEILVRDTANIGPDGVRPGPRHYDANKLELVSATAVYPSWISAPNPPPPDPNADAIAAWNAHGPAIAPYVAGHGIPDSYAAQYQAGRYFGQPIEMEHSQVKEGGIKHVLQRFTCAEADWDSSTGQVIWRTPAGLVKD